MTNTQNRITTNIQASKYGAGASSIITGTNTRQSSTVKPLDASQVMSPQQTINEISAPSMVARSKADYSSASKHIRGRSTNEHPVMNQGSIYQNSQTGKNVID